MEMFQNPLVTGFTIEFPHIPKLKGIPQNLYSEKRELRLIMLHYQQQQQHLSLTWYLSNARSGPDYCVCINPPDLHNNILM